ncbi:hypothetical protein [Bartonella sp. DGB2]|uniref:hypothetical protein n=1 Tax=Bartonella sp. DGB2 TaxID=3388426 RepID=UPI00398F93B2
MQSLSEPPINTEQQLGFYPETESYGLDALRTRGGSSLGPVQSLKFTSAIPRRRVLDYAKTRRVTPFVLLLTIYQMAISAVSGATTVVTGVPFANRLEATT